MPINLLPLSEKLSLKKEAFFKRLLLVFSFCLFCLVLFWFFVFILRIYVISEKVILEKIVETKESFLKNEKFDEFLFQVKKANKNLILVKDKWDNQFYIANLIDRLGVLAGKNISFIRLSFVKNYDPKKNYFAKVVINGVASDREDLLVLQTKLRNKESFEDVYFMPFSWVKPKEVDFSLSFFIKHGDK